MAADVESKKVTSSKTPITKMARLPRTMDLERKAEILVRLSTTSDDDHFHVQQKTIPTYLPTLPRHFTSASQSIMLFLLI